MKENIKKFPTHYTFDLDGTLIDGKGELKDGVVEMFDEILANVKEPVFTIASGARINQVETAMNKINARLKNGQARYNVVANSGSIIRTTSGKMTINALTGRDCSAACNVVSTISPNSIIIYRTMLYDYVEYPKNSTQKALHTILLNVGEKFGIEAQEVDEKDIVKLARGNEVMNILVICLNPKEKKQIFEALQNRFGIGEISISDGTAIDISTYGKKLALVKRFGAETVKKMVYVGDGNNDIEMLSSARHSFGVGKKLKVVSEAVYAITNYKQITDNLFHGKDLTEESKARIEFLKKTFLGKKIKIGFDKLKANKHELEM